jgi:ribosomal protein S18 acetylase RimI-like enzyme
MSDYQTKNRKMAENENRFDTHFKGAWVSGATVWHDAGSNQSHINDLFVCDEQRRQGHGRQMMEHIISEFPDREFSLMVYPDNTGAILLYEQIGFTNDGPLDDIGLQLMTRKGNDNDESKI